MQEMTVENPQQFRIFTRMSDSNLEGILRFVGQSLQRLIVISEKQFCKRTRGCHPQISCHVADKENIPHTFLGFNLTN